ncbi:non-ribosomal peptide synthetase [Paenibacillus sp. 23TSA30-6]|uniref:non-ribosomal peptide synthetase n=1 Tax=Paenibacillus sp. 23TSA30-6 TaxID=2546104 RepID=UPI0030800C89
MKIKDLYPLSPMQEGMLFHSILDQKSEAYFEQTVITSQDILDASLVQQSLQKLVNRYDIFRTVFIYKETERPLQVVLEQREAAPINVENWSRQTDEEKKALLESFLKNDRQIGFDLEKDVPIRLALIRWTEEDSKLIWSFPHIVMDGWCMGTVAQDFFDIYISLRDNTPLKLVPVFPFSSFIQWLERQDKEEAAAYWQRYLLEVENETVVPGYTQSFDSSYRAEQFTSIWEERLTQGLERIAKQYRVTVSTVFQTLWGILLQTYNNSNDVIMGSVVSGRPDEVPGIENMVGLFINTIPVRIISSPEQRFSDLLASVQVSMMESNRYSYLSLADIQSHTSLKQNLIRHIVVFENYPISEDLMSLEEESKAIRITEVEEIEQTNYDLNVVVVPGHKLEIKFSYNELTYDQNMIQLIASHLSQAMEQVLLNPDIRVKDLEFLTTEERRRLLFDFNDTRTLYPAEQTIHHCFEEQAEKTPEAVAIVFENRELTYRELNIKANQLASKLRKLGVQPDTIVAILTERSPEMIIGVLGILKAGAAYLPIDPSYPQDRITFMLQDSRSNILLTLSGRGSQTTGFEFSGTVLDLGDIGSYDADVFTSFNLSATTADHLAYVMYTSGSTGRPKGVMIEHRNVIRLVKNTNYVQFAENDRILMTGALVFDACTFEIWGALLNGLRLYIVPESIILNAVKLGTALEQNHISTMWLTSPLFNQLALQKPELFSPLKYLLVGGDVLSPAIIANVREKCPGLTIINGYGPTENTTFSCCFPIEKEYSNIPIGRPIGNSTAYILDSSNRLLPIGTQGEICVGGDGLARGYLNRDDLTQEKFVPNPFIPGEKMYRTGDLGRWLPDGYLEYLGRIDQQVKIRGYRIEPGEIETRLMGHEDIHGVYVALRTTNDGQKTLCAYIATDAVLTMSGMKAHLAGQLPDYMIPAQYVFLPVLPLNTNGKIDRQALPEPETISSPQVEYTAPRNEVERQLANLWQTVLGAERVGIDDSFFELGGHSLKAIQLVSKAQELNIPLEIHQLLQYQTIRSLYDLLQRGEEGGENTSKLISDSQEAGRIIGEAFGAHALLRTVSSAQQDYLFLQLEPFHAEQVQDITEFIQSHIHPELYPHYIIPWGTDEPYRICGIPVTDDSELTSPEQEACTQHQAEEWVANIADLNTEWSTNILAPDTIGQYPLAPVQLYHLQHPVGSGMSIRLDSYLDILRLTAAILRLIHRHELLRSVIVKSDETWAWGLKPAPEHISLPTVDLSGYPIYIQQRLLSYMVPKLYEELYEQTHSLQYRIVLIRLNLREQLLLLPCSHIIFDATSGGILRRQLLDEYHHPQPAPQPAEANQYRDYVEHICQGPQGISDQQINKQFRLQMFGENNDRIQALTQTRNHEVSTKYHWRLDLSDTPELGQSANMWSLSLQMASQFFSTYFHISEVPLWMTNYGRQYGDQNYFGTMGECIDHIPIVLQEDDIVAREKGILAQLDSATRHHLNFFNLIINADMEEAYPDSSRILKKGLEQLPVVFNYLGESREDSALFDHMDVDGQKASVNEAIFFETQHVGQVLEISLILPYEEDRQYIHQIFQAASDRLLNALTISQ